MSGAGAGGVGVLSGRGLGTRDVRRKWHNRLMVTLLSIASVVAIVPLLSVFGYVIQQGWPALSVGFFTQVPAPVGESGGGILNAMLGSLILVGVASLIGVPWGIGIGIFLSEFGQGKLAQTLRVVMDLLASIPSIVIGLFAYAMLVAPFGRFSALSGALALAILMIPTVARTTEELLKLMPTHIREAGLALGIPRWRVILQVVVRGSLGGISTGVILAIARAAGETAPLLFTALNNRFLSANLTQPIASLPVQIYTYAVSPYEEWHAKAWAASLVLVMFVFVLNLATRLALARSGQGQRGGVE